jgi:hypothetical protein
MQTIESGKTNGSKPRQATRKAQPASGREKPAKGRPGLPKDDQIVELGRAAWERRKQGADWEDWKAVGAALLVGRREAMREAQTNEPAGKAYSKAFSDWLKAHHFDDIDKSDRAKLLQMMEKLEDVEAYRASLSPAERMRLNHPNSVWRAFTSPDPGKAFLGLFLDDDEEDDDDGDKGLQKRNGEDTETAETDEEQKPAPPEQEEQKPDGGRDGLERNIKRWWSGLLEIVNKIESDNFKIESETGLAEYKAESSPELLAMLRATVDLKALPTIRAAGQRRVESGARLIQFTNVLEKLLAPPAAEEQPAQAEAV